MKEVLKLIRDVLKERKELKRYNSILATMPLNIEALQYIVNSAIAKNISIKIEQKDGTIITITPNLNQIGYESFKDKFSKARNLG